MCVQARALVLLCKCTHPPVGMCTDKPHQKFQMVELIMPTPRLIPAFPHLFKFTCIVRPTIRNVI